MFDSLNRHYLPPYGCDWVHAPNFSKLAQSSVVFENAYVGSMPCIPARRELHTGRYNFLHRSWGPVEPFDDSMPEILRKNGIYTHLVTDHAHYWEDGGATYHNRYSSYEFSRGQEGDRWIADLRKFPEPEYHGSNYASPLGQQDFINRRYMGSEDLQPQSKTFRKGLEFIEKNANEDNWFLQIETFDPHEPFFTQQKYKDYYPHEYHGPLFDWPDYKRVTEDPELVRHLQYEYASLVSMCDHNLGKITAAMDAHDLWKDTLLIVNTDHGFMLGEHGWWAKTLPPWYNELANIPLFIWDPRAGIKGERRKSLVQTIDLAPTILDFFGLTHPADAQGHSLKGVIKEDQPVRKYGLFGVFGGHVNITDGEYVYMRSCADASNTPLNEYTLMPTHMEDMFSVGELRNIELAGPFAFTKGCQVMKIKGKSWTNPAEFGNLLFNLRNDPRQLKPVQDADVEATLVKEMVRLMRENDAPAEQYLRLGLDRNV